MDQHPTLNPSLFRQLRQREAYKAWLYRSGRLSDWINLPSTAITPAWQSVPVPRPGHWQGHHIHNASIADQFPPFGFFKSYQKTHEQRADTRQMGPAQTFFVADLPKVIDTQEHNLVFKKVLGWGGLGLAALYSVQEKLKGGIQRKHRFDIVVKFFLPEAVEDFEGEKKNHVLLARSRHVVQLVPIKKPPKGVDDNKESRELKGRRRRGVRKRTRGETHDSGDDDDDERIGKRNRPVGRKGGLGNYYGMYEPRPSEPDKWQVLKALGGGPRWALKKVVGGLKDWSGFGLDGSAETKEDEERRGVIPVQDEDDDDLFIERTMGVDEEALEESTATLFLEVMGRGNLHSWICKMGQADRFSDKALWLMFDCLFKGVVGMAHPPKLARKEEYEKTGGKWDRTHFDEQIPFWDVANKTSNDLVHFDLDPINILVGDFNVGRDKAHTMIPIMKVADLGLMNEMKDHREGNAEMMWGVRTCGKAFDGWLAPEQFHEEWDYLRNPLPDREYDPKTKPKTAGKYSWRTNVYWLGLVMFTLVTRMYAPLEPIPYSLGQVYVTDERTGRVKRRDPWSYGGYLMHDNFKDKVDRDLLMAVTCCMCDDPEHRPSLKELSDMITFKISQKWPSETDDQTRQWAAGFFSEPGQAGPEEPELVSGIPIYDIPDDDQFPRPGPISDPPDILTGTDLFANDSADRDLQVALSRVFARPRGRFQLSTTNKATPSAAPSRPPPSDPMLAALREITRPPQARRTLFRRGKEADALAKLLAGVNINTAGILDDSE